MDKKKKDKKWTTLLFALGILFFIGAAVLEFCYDVDVDASPPGVWVCVAEAKIEGKPKYSCEATARSTSRKKAEKKAVENCDLKCSFEAKCVVTACARRR